jgi:hypothetical protein
MLWSLAAAWPGGPRPVPCIEAIPFRKLECAAGAAHASGRRYRGVEVPANPHHRPAPQRCGQQRCCRAPGVDKMDVPRALQSSQPRFAPLGRARATLIAPAPPSHPFPRPLTGTHPPANPHSPRRSTSPRRSSTSSRRSRPGSRPWPTSRRPRSFASSTSRSTPPATDCAAAPHAAGALAGRGARTLRAAEACACILAVRGAGAGPRGRGRGVSC